MITTTDELIKKVEDEYFDYNNESELTCMFFDFDVDMPCDNILFAYAQIQHDINGDFVWYREIGGHYKGNCRKFLEQFNDRGEDYARFTEDGEPCSCFIF